MNSEKKESPEKFADRQITKLLNEVYHLSEDKRKLIHELNLKTNKIETDDAHKELRKNILYISKIVFNQANEIINLRKYRNQETEIKRLRDEKSFYMFLLYGFVALLVLLFFWYKNLQQENFAYQDLLHQKLNTEQIEFYQLEQVDSLVMGTKALYPGDSAKMNIPNTNLKLIITHE